MLSLMDHHSWLAYVLDLFAKLPKLTTFFCIMRTDELFRYLFFLTATTFATWQAVELVPCLAGAGIPAPSSTQCYLQSVHKMKGPPSYCGLCEPACPCVAGPESARVHSVALNGSAATVAGMDTMAAYIVRQLQDVCLLL